ncbi:MAG: formylglycine-generating enzyme family protein [Prosthecobacter sp.]
MTKSSLIFVPRGSFPAGNARSSGIHEHPPRSSFKSANAMSKETNNFPAQAGQGNTLNNSVDNSVGKKTTNFFFNLNVGHGKAVGAVTVAGIIAAAIFAATGTTAQKTSSEPALPDKSKITPKPLHAPGGVPSLDERRSSEKGKQHSGLPEASNDKPFVNAISMPFVPIRTTLQDGPFATILACQFETRVKDFRAFVNESQKATSQGEYEAAGDGVVRGSWEDPGFPQGDNHPVVWVSYREALDFCHWLTIKERTLGIISLEQEYRLPTTAEWLKMFKDVHGAAETLFEKMEGNWADATLDRHASQPAGRFPWKEIGVPPIPYYDDGSVWTSAAGESQRNQEHVRNLWDLPGNVWEFTLAQQVSNGDPLCTILGGAWNYGIQNIDSPAEDLKIWCSSGRVIRCSTRHYSVGFRCVLARVVHLTHVYPK